MCLMWMVGLGGVLVCRLVWRGFWRGCGVSCPGLVVVLAGLLGRPVGLTVLLVVPGRLAVPVVLLVLVCWLVLMVGCVLVVWAGWVRGFLTR